MLSRSDLLEMLQDNFIPKHTSENARLDRIDLWARHEHEEIMLPTQATREHQELRRMSKTPVLGLVESAISQNLFVNGARFPAAPDSTAWQSWQANRMDAKQTRIYRSTTRYGYSYLSVMPGLRGDRPMSKMRAISARNAWAVYQDPAEDEWPMYVAEWLPTAIAGAQIVTITDEEYRYRLGLENGQWRYIDHEVHGTGVCPIARYTFRLDLEGRAESALEPLIGVASRVDKTMYDRLLAQHFNSWKVRTVAGLANFASGTEEAKAKKLKLAQDDVLVAEDPDTKFGTLDGTPLDGFTAAYESDMGTLAALGQVPITSLDSKISNISADAISELRASNNALNNELKVSFGNTHVQALQIAALQSGDRATYDDFAAEMLWDNREAGTFSAIVDGLGKAATMLQIPAERLWKYMPGISQTEIESWQKAPTEPTPDETVAEQPQPNPGGSHA